MITNAQKLQASVDLNYQIDSSALEGALIDVNLRPEDEYKVENKKAVDRASVAVIDALLSSSDISEGGIKLTVANRETLLKKRSLILGQKSTVTGLKVW